MIKIEKNIFKETFKDIITSITQLPKISLIESKDLNYDELTIIKALCAYKKKDFKVSLKLLEKIKSLDPYILATKKFLLAKVQKEHKDYSSSIENLKEAHSFYQKDNNELAYLPLVSLFKIYVLQNDIANMKTSLCQLESYPNFTPHIRYSKIQAQCLYFLLTGKLEDAKALLQKTINNPKKGLERHIQSLQKTLFYVHFESCEFKSCYKVLGFYKLNTGFKVQSNYTYMKILLDHITLDTPIPLTRKLLKDSSENEWKVETLYFLSLLQEHNASSSWQKLQLLNPLLFQDNFYYRGSDSLFGSLLKKYRAGEQKAA